MVEISNEDAMYIRNLHNKEQIKEFAFGTDRERNIYRVLKKISVHIDKKNIE